MEKTFHTEHCCFLHGCKYGDKNCPVQAGRVRQSFMCEHCDYELENGGLEIAYLLNEMYDKGYDAAVSASIPNDDSVTTSRIFCPHGYLLHDPCVSE